jgi:small subunit ribosomal protein S20
LAHIKSQEKRNRQNEKKRAKNSQVKSSIRTASKRVQTAVESKDKEGSTILFKKLTKNIDSAAQKGVVHKKTAARKKSRLAKKVNSLAAKQ